MPSTPRSTTFVVRCSKCGGALAVAPGWPTSKCAYCGFDQPIDAALRRRILAHVHRVEAELELLDAELRKRAVQTSAPIGLLTAGAIMAILGSVVSVIVGLCLSDVSDGTRALVMFGPSIVGFALLFPASILTKRARDRVVAPTAPMLRALCRGCGASIPMTSDTGQTECPSCGQPVVADPALFDQAVKLLEDAERRVEPSQV